MLNEKQKEAVELIGSRKYKIVGLFGAGGTGKSFVVSHLPKHLKIACTAPTNKAVKVLVNSGLPEQDCMTIFSFLGLVLSESTGKISIDKKGQSKAAYYDILVIDEASMINDALLAEIDKALEFNHRLYVVFMGDMCQFPPVGQKRSNAFDRCQKSVLLTEQMRQKNENVPLNRLIADLRELADEKKNTPPYKKIDDFGQYHGQIMSENGYRIGVNCVTDQEKFEKYIIHAFKHDKRDFDNVIVAYRNERVDYYNELVHKKLFPPKPRADWHDYDPPMDYFPICKGETMIVQQPIKLDAIESLGEEIETVGEIVYSVDARIKIAEIEYKNQRVDLPGERGFLIRYVLITDELTGTKIKAVVDRNNFARLIEIYSQRLNSKDEKCKFKWSHIYALKSSLADVRHSYAITGHKSQGSTYDNAFIDIQDISSMPENQLTKNQGLYVAVSRVRFNAILKI